MLKFNKLFILSIGAIAASTTITSAALKEDEGIGLKVRAASGLFNSDLGVEYKITPKVALGDNPDLTGHASISLDASYTSQLTAGSWYAYGAMANYTITYKKAYFSAGGGGSFQPRQLRYPNGRREDPASINYCFQATIGYNFHDTKGLGVELRGWGSPNKGFNGLGLGLTWRL